MASNGEYTNAAGEKKKRWIRVGTLFKGEDGSLSQKLDVIPIGPEWSGWFNLYPLDDPQQQGGGQQTQQQPQNAAAQAQGAPDGDEDIPF